MVCDSSPILISHLTYNIFPESFSCHGMKKYGIFIPKLYYSLGEPLRPICIFHREEISYVSFYDDSEGSLLGKQNSDLFKLVKKGNGEVAIVNQFGQIG